MRPGGSPLVLSVLRLLLVPPVVVAVAVESAQSLPLPIRDAEGQQKVATSRIICVLEGHVTFCELKNICMEGVEVTDVRRCCLVLKHGVAQARPESLTT